MSDELHQELKRHATSLRGLARDLLRDAHAADDVTQQTLAKAWTSRKRLRPGPLGGWLQRTLTNFSRQWQRGERRRANHERTSATQREQHTAAEDEQLARRETLRDVTTAVLQLEEPYQTTVFLRYFEDLPPREIARRTNVAVSTVKSRLARGLTMLRARLATRTNSSDWRAALAGAFGLPLASVLLPTATGALLMKTSLKVALAAVALCVGGLLLYEEDPTPAPATTTTVDAHASHAAVSATSTREDIEIASTRVDATPKTFVEPWLDHPFVLELELLIIDPLGLPIEDHSPRIAPPAGALQHASKATGPDGRVLLRWPSRVPRGSVEVFDERGHRQLVHLQHARRTKRTMLRNGSGVSYVRLLSNTLIIADNDNGSSSYFTTPPSPPKPGDDDAALHPHAIFHEDGVVAVATDATDDPDYITDIAIPLLTQSRRDVSTWLASATIESSVNIEGIQWSEVPNKTATEAGIPIEGTVFGEDGKPAAEVPVAIFGTGPQPRKRTQTDEHGHFRVDGLQPGTFTVRAGGTEQGLGTTTVDAHARAPKVTMQLRRDACIRGVLIDENGKAIANADIDWHADDGSWADRATTADDGTFLLANLPHIPGRITAWASEGRSFPIAHELGVLPNTGTQTLKASAGKGSQLSLQPTASPHLDLSKLRVRVRQLDSGMSRGISTPHRTVSSTDDEGNIHKVSISAPELPWTIANLPTGNYEIEVWLAGSGRLHCGRHYVDGITDCALGSLALAEPGRVHFEPPSEGPAPGGFSVELTELRRAFDIRIDTLTSTANDVLLAPGAYALGIRDAGGNVRFVRFTVRSGETSNVPLVW